MRLKLIILYFLPNILFAQSIKLIVLSNNTPVSYASITLSNNNFAITNEIGITYINAPELFPLVVKVSCIGYVSKVDTIFNYVNYHKIEMKQYAHQLEVAYAQGYTDLYLIRYVNNILKKVSVNDNLFETCYSETYSLENEKTMIERFKSTLIFTYQDKKLNDIKYKSGNIAINKNNLNEQFRTEALTRLLLITNPQYATKGPLRLYTLFSFFDQDPKQILKYFKVSYIKLNHDLEISIKHIEGKYELLLNINDESNQLIELRQQWLIVDKYPITTNYPNASIQDTLKIITSHYYKEMTMQAFTFFCGISYKVKDVKYRISTYSNGIIDTSKKYYPPVSFLSSMNDYTNILAIPETFNRWIHKVGNFKNTFLDSIFETQYVLVNSLNLVDDTEESNSETEKIFESISLISHWSYEWALDWNLLRYFDNLRYSNSNSIKIYLWGDFYFTDFGTTYIVEPIFDYNVSYYQDVRDINSKFFIELLMHHAKYLTLKLKKELLVKHSSNITHSEFKRLVIAYQKQLEKDIFRYKSITNFGKDADSLAKVRKEIFDNLLTLL